MFCKGKKSKQRQQDSHPISSDNLNLLNSFVEHVRRVELLSEDILSTHGNKFSGDKSEEGASVAVALGFYLFGPLSLAGDEFWGLITSSGVSLFCSSS